MEKCYERWEGDIQIKVKFIHKLGIAKTNTYHVDTLQNVWLTSFHKKESCPFPPPHILTTILFYYISITFNHFKFVNGLLH
jgi:hypothetical protein